jgi:hypothetical protein
VAKTEEELAKLGEDQVDRDHLIWTEYFFSHFFSEWHERQAFREALRAAGFTGIGSDEEMSGDGYWHHWSHTIRRADPEALRAADETAAAIAETHGVRYDEWAIVRNVSGRASPGINGRYGAARGRRRAVLRDQTAAPIASTRSRD